MSNKEYIINWDIETTTSVKNKTTLVFENDKLSDLTFLVNNGILTCKKNDKEVTLSDFAKIKFAKTKEDEETLTNTDLIANSLIDNTEILSVPKKNKITGTNYNDVVNLEEFRRYDSQGNEVNDVRKTTKGVSISTLKGKDKVTASIYSDTIKTGDGDDTVYSSLGNDKITCGKGENTIEYSGYFDTDTITLTKTENLTLDLTSYGIALENLTFTPKSKDLEIEVKKEGVLFGTIILKSFKKSNVVGANGAVLIDFGEGEPIDLNTANFLYWSKSDFSSKGVFTDTRFSETIDARDVYTPYGKNNKGVTINAGAGYNTIIGTDGFNDTITGGNDGNDITSGAGNNTIKTGNGTDIVRLNSFGNNTVKTGKGDDKIYVSSVTSANIYSGAGVNEIHVDNLSNFGNIVIKEENVKATNKIIFDQAIDEDYYIEKSGKNLIITKDNNSASLTVNNYYATGKKTAITSFYYGDEVKTLDDLISSSKGFLLNGAGNIQGTDNKDLIIANDYKSDKISNDNITPHKGKDTINAGKGENNINLYSGDGAKTIVDGGGDDTLVFTEGSDLSLEYNNTDLIITYGSETDTVKLSDYKNTSSSVQYLRIGNDKVLLEKYDRVIFIDSDAGDKSFNNNVWANTLEFEAGTEVSYDYDDGNLIVNYGDYKVTLEDYNKTSSIKYIKIGDTITELSDLYIVLDRGSEQETLTVDENNSCTILLTNRFDNKKYSYNITSSSGKQTFTVEHLKNDRIVISGDHLEITASDGQADDIILLGGHNTLNTGDENDIIRLGDVIDAKGIYYFKQSDFNTINTDDGDDYVEYYGLKNNIDMGNGNDKVYINADSVVIEDENIVNAEIIRAYSTSIPMNNQINWYNQGGGGGDCRLFALLDSLSKQENFDLNDYVEIVENEDDSYDVTFKNYTSGQNKVTATKDDLANFYDTDSEGHKLYYVYGDLDVIITDYALNKLININKNLDQQALSDYAEGSITIYTLDTVQKAYYNTLSNYFFGNEYITPVNYDSAQFETRLNELWTLYNNKTIANITVGIQANRSDYKNGILTGHAYSILDLTDSYITLINPWDNADKLTIDLDTFYNSKPCVMVYGCDYYDEHYIVDNGFISINNNYINNIASETANWTAIEGNNSISDLNYAQNEVETIGAVLYTSNPEIIN